MSTIKCEFSQTLEARDCRVFGGFLIPPYRRGSPANPQTLKELEQAIQRVTRRWYQRVLLLGR